MATSTSMPTTASLVPTHDPLPATAAAAAAAAAILYQPQCLDLFFYSAPSSPRSSPSSNSNSNSYAFLSSPSSPSSSIQIPLQYPGNPKLGDDLEFDFGNSGHLHMMGTTRPPLSADELFDRGMIRPLNLKLPSSSSSSYTTTTTTTTPTTTTCNLASAANSTCPTNTIITSNGSRLKPPPTIDPRYSSSRGSTSPKSKSATALQRPDPNSAADPREYDRPSPPTSMKEDDHDPHGGRGRRRNHRHPSPNSRPGSGLDSSTSPSSISTAPARKGISRSLSPIRLRVSEFALLQQQQQQQPHIAADRSPDAAPTRKWRLKDLFLFRSASEGRAASRYPFKKNEEDYQSTKPWSVRSLHFDAAVGSISSRRPAAKDMTPLLQPRRKAWTFRFFGF
ncbi:hypothetical protein Dimus_002252 [Dionaea muscipula]